LKVKGKMRLRHEDVRVPEVECPACGHKLNAASQMEALAARPKPGDYTVCIGCCAVFIFGEDLVARGMTMSEALKFSQDPETQGDIEKAIRAIRRMQASRN
jgi:hypothetical protein